MTTFTICFASLAAILPIAYIRILAQRYRRFKDSECRRSYIVTAVFSGLVFTVAALALAFNILLTGAGYTGILSRVSQSLTFTGIVISLCMNQSIKSLSDKDKEKTGKVKHTDNEKSA